MAHINNVTSFDEFLSLQPDAKDMEYQTGKDDNHAWKLHIFLNQEGRTVSDPLIKDTVKFLIDNKVSFKMGNGGDGGKVFTIYVGEYDQASQIAQQLNKQFGNEYAEDFPEGAKSINEDMPIFNNIGMRFEGIIDTASNSDSSFMYYGHKGIPSLDTHLQFNKMNNWELSSLASHIFLAEKCGAKYLGSDYEKNPWANKIFRNLLDQYTYQEISDYVSSALKWLRETHQERFIHKKNLVSPEQGVILSLKDIISEAQPQSDHSKTENADEQTDESLILSNTSKKTPSDDGGVVIENQSDDNDKKQRPDLLSHLEAAWKKREVKFQRLYPDDQYEYPYGYNLGTEDAEKDQPTGRATLKEKNHLVLESNDLTQFVATMEGIKNAGHNSISLNLKGTDEEKKAFAAKAIVAGMIAGVEIKDFPYDLKELKQFDERIEKVMRIEKVKHSINNAPVNAPDEEVKKAINDVYDTYTQIAKDLIPSKDQLKVFESGVEAAKHSRHKRLAKEVLQQRQAATTRS